MGAYTGIYRAKCVRPNLLEVRQTIQGANIQTIAEHNGFGDTLARLDTVLPPLPSHRGVFHVGFYIIVH